MGRYFGFSVANLMEGKFGTRGVAHIGVYLIIFFSFILHEILYKAYHLGLCVITFK